MSVFGVSRVRIFPHLDWMRRVTEDLSIFGPNVEKLQTRKTLDKDIFTQWCFPSSLSNTARLRLLYDCCTQNYGGCWKLFPKKVTILFKLVKANKPRTENVVEIGWQIICEMSTEQRLNKRSYCIWKEATTEISSRVLNLSNVIKILLCLQSKTICCIFSINNSHGFRIVSNI